MQGIEIRRKIIKFTWNRVKFDIINGGDDFYLERMEFFFKFSKMNNLIKSSPGINIKRTI